MDRFLTCLCDDDLTALIIDGKAEEQELRETWLLILSEYYELRGDSIEGVDQWRITSEIIRLQNHLFLLQQCVNFLQDRYSESIAQSLRKLGYSFNPSVKEPGEYLELLYVISNKSKTKYVRLQQLIKELQQHVSKLSDEKPKREYFEQSIIAIEEMQKTVYNLEYLTVSKYVLLEKKFHQYVEKITRHGRAH